VKLLRVQSRSCQWCLKTGPLLVRSGLPLSYWYTVISITVWAGSSQRCRESTYQSSGP